VAELLAGYLRHAKAYYRQSEALVRIRYAIRPLRELYGRTRATEFGPLRLKTVRQRMVNAGWCRKQVNSQVGQIKRAFRWAVSEELIPPSILHGLESVEGLRRGHTEARETEPVRPVPDAVVDKTLKHLPSIVADMVRLQRLTGARPSELCMMRPADIDRTGEVWIYSPVEHKTAHLGRRRTICIGPKAQNILRPYLLRPSESYCFSPQESERKRRVKLHEDRKTPMSCGNRPGTNRKAKPKRTPGEHYDRDAYRRAIHRACVIAEVEQWSPHRLRHSAATEIRKRYGLEAAAVVLGHARADVTQIYAERDQDLAKRIIAEVG
jgi:integrase